MINNKSILYLVSICNIRLFYMYLIPLNIVVRFKSLNNFRNIDCVAVFRNQSHCFSYRLFTNKNQEYGRRTAHPKALCFFLQEESSPLGPSIVMQAWTICANCCWKRTESTRTMSLPGQCLQECSLYSSLPDIITMAKLELRMKRICTARHLVQSAYSCQKEQIL